MPSTCTAAREKPHWGASGVPFMKSTTSDCVISCRSRAFSCSGLSAVLEGGEAGARSVVDWGLGAVEGEVCLASSEVSLGASAPDMRERRVWPYDTERVGVSG